MIKATWVKTYIKGLDKKDFSEDFEYRCVVARDDFSDFSEEEALKSKLDIAKDIVNTCSGKELKMPAEFSQTVIQTYLEGDLKNILTVHYEELSPLPIPSKQKDHYGILYVGPLRKLLDHQHFPKNKFPEEDLDRISAIFVGSFGQQLLCVYHEELIKEENLIFLVIRNYRATSGKMIRKLVCRPFGSPEDAIGYFEAYAMNNPVASETVNVYVRAGDYEKELLDPWFHKELERVLRKEA